MNDTTLQAIGRYEAMAKQYQQADDLYNAATTLTHIGNLWSDLGEKRKARTAFENALPLYAQLGNQHGTAITLTNIAMMWSDVEEPYQALDFYQQACTIHQKLGNQALEADADFHIAMLYLNEGELDEAIHYLERCVMLEEQIQHPDLALNRQQLEQIQTMRERDIRIDLRDLDMMIKDTVEACTSAQAKRDRWRENLANRRQQCLSKGARWQAEVEFADALLALVQGETPTLPDGNPYQAALQKVLRSIDHYHKGE